MRSLENISNKELMTNVMVLKKPCKYLKFTICDKHLANSPQVQPDREGAHDTRDQRVLKSFWTRVSIKMEAAFLQLVETGLCYLIFSA